MLVRRSIDETTRHEPELELRERQLYTNDENVFISAKRKEGIEELRERLMHLIKESYAIRYPHQVKAW